jgi:hypothetical protein
VWPRLNTGGREADTAATAQTWCDGCEAESKVVVALAVVGKLLARVAGYRRFRRSAMDELLADRVRQVEDRPMRIWFALPQSLELGDQWFPLKVPRLLHPGRHDRKRLVVA